MSKCIFKNSQRVLLPAFIAGENVQAVIVARKEFAWREPEYDLQWLLADTFGSLGPAAHLLGHNATTLSESILVAVQPTSAPSNLKSKSAKRRR